MPLMSRQHIDDHALVARYLANQLTGAERESFEQYFLEHPELLEELNRTAQFKAGLLDLQESGQLAAALTAKTSFSRTAIFAVAATVLVAMTAVIGIWLGRATPSLIAASINDLTPPFAAHLQLNRSIRIERTRSSSYDATIVLPANPAAIELRIKPAVVAASGKYWIRMSQFAADDSVKPVATLNGVAPDADALISVYLNSANLSPAVYELQIADAAATTADPSNAFLIEAVPTAENK
jgi:hypothetical protein